MATQLTLEGGQWFRFESEDDCDGTPIKLPTKFELCPRCEGSGVHDHPAFANGITREDFDEDPDFREEYMSGAYDVRCSECDGQRVVSVVDEERLPEDLRDAYSAWENDRAAYAQEEAYYRRCADMGMAF